MQPSTARRAQTVLPADLHRRLRDLAYHTERSIADLLLDGVVLLLRYHDRGEGLPEPTLPRAP